MKLSGGKYAICAKGRIGLIAEKVSGVWIGQGIDGKPWTSSHPLPLLPEQLEILANDSELVETILDANRREG
jgi:hypothetical protein